MTSIACITGFIGDILLQIGAKYFGFGGKTGWGLIPYFRQHGSTESLFIAGGMMSLFYIIYLYLIPLPVTYSYLGGYGIVLDFIFRKTMLFPSLSGYYNYFSYAGSAFWGAIPAIVPLFIYRMLHVLW